MVIHSELLNYSFLLLFCPYILNNYFIVTVSQIAVNNQLCLIETLNGNNYDTWNVNQLISVCVFKRRKELRESMVSL